MAYMRDLDKKCGYMLCDRRAVVEVVNRRNASLGVFCRQHGKRVLEDRQREESKGF